MLNFWAEVISASTRKLWKLVKNIAIFASGTGTNAQKIIEHFEDDPEVNVRLVVSNKSDAPVLAMAENYRIATLTLKRSDFYHTNDLLKVLQDDHIDWIVLAGFLWLIPEYLVEAYQNRMVNIHPALLPKFGGRGMYGHYVHQAVKEAEETETGISIHYVNQAYDEGQIIFQATTPVTPDDTPETIAQKVRKLEHQHFPKVIEQLIKSTNV
jgi:phosphoribosylglycinamide formyltransferase-1